MPKKNLRSVFENIEADVFSFFLFYSPKTCFLLSRNASARRRNHSPVNHGTPQARCLERHTGGCSRKLSFLSGRREGCVLFSFALPRVRRGEKTRTKKVSSETLHFLSPSLARRRRKRSLFRLTISPCPRPPAPRSSQPRTKTRS